MRRDAPHAEAQRQRRLVDTLRTAARHPQRLLRRSCLQNTEVSETRMVIAWHPDACASVYTFGRLQEVLLVERYQIYGRYAKCQEQLNFK